MAEFCKKCVLEFVGTKNDFPELSQTEYDLLLTAWTLQDEGICEECGFKYLEEN